MTGRNWKSALYTVLLSNMDTKSTNVDANEKEIDLSQTSISELLAEDPSLLGGDDVAELLQRLSSADSMAQGMESKIDGVLQDLDGLLALLGAEETPRTSEDVDSTSAPGTSETLQP
jgi:hypothetical protein